MVHVEAGTPRIIATLQQKASGAIYRLLSTIIVRSPLVLGDQGIRSSQAEVWSLWVRNLVESKQRLKN